MKNTYSRLQYIVLCMLLLLLITISIAYFQFDSIELRIYTLSANELQYTQQIIFDAKLWLAVISLISGFFIILIGINLFKDVISPHRDQLVFRKTLAKALKQDHLFLMFQPQLSLKANKIIGAEALIRWTDPKSGPISPAEFIAKAESAQVMPQLGFWIIENAFAQFSQWQQQGLTLDSVSVNVSAQQLKSEHLFDDIFILTEKYHIDPKTIKFEITETEMVDDYEKISTLLERLQSLGFQIAMDDFGTGLCSLSYLKHLHFDVIKIDQSFIRNCQVSETDSLLLKNILRLAHDLKVEVVAEGIEFEEQIEFLKKEQCQTVQGYYISRPLMAKEFEEFVRNFG